MGAFKPEPKMKTTEPSVELKLKKGGRAKKMADGGIPTMGVAARPTPLPTPESRLMPAPARPNVGKPYGKKPIPVLLGRKKGGDVESPSEHKAEMKRMGKIEKELSRHESMKASKAHAGLKKGGATTGGIEGRGYKNGGVLKPKINAQDKVVTAKQVKGFNTKTSGLEAVQGRKYAKGGTVSDSVANRYKNTKVVDGASMPNKTGKTGSVKQTVAGYKSGGHVQHQQTASKHSCGHTMMKKGGKCNY